MRNLYCMIFAAAFLIQTDMNNEEKILTAKAEDLYRLCEKHCEAKFSAFLTNAERMVISEKVGGRVGFETEYYGGYAEAERRIMGVFPEWELERKFPVSLLIINKTYEAQLSHRDYLGAILSLGLKRNKIGDILVCCDGAYVFVCDDIADYICSGIKKIANCGVSIKKADVNNAELPEKEFKTITAVAASDRLDALLAAALNISRREASLLINSGKVSLNHKEISSVSAAVKESDLMSVRGYGRVILEKIGNTTGSGRIHVIFKKYK